MTNKQLIKKFLEGAKSGKNSTGNLGIYGNELVHYETVIARRDRSGGLLVSNHKYSRTTSKIISLLHSYYWGFISYVPHEWLNDKPYQKREWGAKLNYQPVDPIFQL
jgi:hypothetical protein